MILHQKLILLNILIILSLAKKQTREILNYLNELNVDEFIENNEIVFLHYYDNRIDESSAFK